MATHELIVDAYSKLAQGILIKSSSPKEIILTLKAIMDYWLVCAISS